MLLHFLDHSVSETWVHMAHVCAWHPDQTCPIVVGELCLEIDREKLIFLRTNDLDRTGDGADHLRTHQDFAQRETRFGSQPHVCTLGAKALLPGRQFERSPSHERHEDVRLDEPYLERQVIDTAAVRQGARD